MSGISGLRLGSNLSSDRRPFSNGCGVEDWAGRWKERYLQFHDSVCSSRLSWLVETILYFSLGKRSFFFPVTDCSSTVQKGKPSFYLRSVETINIPEGPQLGGIKMTLITGQRQWINLPLRLNQLSGVRK